METFCLTLLIPLSIRVRVGVCVCAGERLGGGGVVVAECKQFSDNVYSNILLTFLYTHIHNYLFHE